jgi:hypothetical protein
VSSQQKWQQMKTSLPQTRGTMQEPLSRRWQQKSKIPSVLIGVSSVDDFEVSILQALLIMEGLQEDGHKILERGETTKVFDHKWMFYNEGGPFKIFHEY